MQSCGLQVCGLRPVDLRANGGKPRKVNWVRACWEDGPVNRDGTTHEVASTGVSGWW